MVRSRPATNPLKQIKHILADHRKSGLPTEAGPRPARPCRSRRSCPASPDGGAPRSRGPASAGSGRDGPVGRPEPVHDERTPRLSEGGTTSTGSTSFTGSGCRWVATSTESGRRGWPRCRAAIPTRRSSTRSPGSSRVARRGRGSSRSSSGSPLSSRSGAPHDPPDLSLGQVARIPAQHPPELLLGEPAAEPRARVLLGARDEGDAESAAERTAPAGAASRLALRLVHAGILALRRSQDHRVRAALSRTER